MLGDAELENDYQSVLAIKEKVVKKNKDFFNH